MPRLTFDFPPPLSPCVAPLPHAVRNCQSMPGSARKPLPLSDRQPPLSAGAQVAPTPWHTAWPRLWLAVAVCCWAGCGSAETQIPPDEAPVVLRLPPEEDSSTDAVQTIGDRVPSNSTSAQTHSRQTSRASAAVGDSRSRPTPTHPPVGGPARLSPGETLQLVRQVTQTVEQTDEQGPAGGVSAHTTYELDLFCEGETVPPSDLPGKPPTPATPTVSTPEPRVARQLRLTVRQVAHTVHWPDTAAEVSDEQPSSEPNSRETDPSGSGSGTAPAQFPSVTVRFWLSPGGEVVAVDPGAWRSPRDEAAPVRSGTGLQNSAGEPASGHATTFPPEDSGVRDGLQAWAGDDPAGWIAEWLCLVPTPPGASRGPWREIRDVASPVACRKTTEYRDASAEGAAVGPGRAIAWRAQFAPPAVRLAGGGGNSEWQLVEGSETGEVLPATAGSWPGPAILRQTLKLHTLLEDGRQVWQIKRVEVILRRRS